MIVEPQLPAPALQTTAETTYSVFDKRPLSEQLKGPKPAFISQAWLDSPAQAVTSNLSTGGIISVDETVTVKLELVTRLIDISFGAKRTITKSKLHKKWYFVSSV